MRFSHYRGQEVAHCAKHCAIISRRKGISTFSIYDGRRCWIVRDI